MSFKTFLNDLTSATQKLTGTSDPIVASEVPAKLEELAANGGSSSGGSLEVNENMSGFKYFQEFKNNIKVKIDWQWLEDNYSLITNIINNAGNAGIDESKEMQFLFENPLRLHGLSGTSTPVYFTQVHFMVYLGSSALAVTQFFKYSDNNGNGGTSAPTDPINVQFSTLTSQGSDVATLIEYLNTNYGSYTLSLPTSADVSISGSYLNTTYNLTVETVYLLNAYYNSYDSTTSMNITNSLNSENAGFISFVDEA